MTENLHGESDRLYIKVLLASILAVLVVSILILLCVPPVSKDALVHHLATPKLYLEHGGMYEIPFMPFSYFPMNLDLLYLIPLYFGNDIIPKFMHFCFALFTAWLIFGYLKRRISTPYGLAGALFFLSIPIIVKLSITVYVDLGVIFFSTASLILFLKWIENGFQTRFLIFSALCCGLGLGTKYTGLVTFFLLTMFVPFAYSRFNHGKRPGFFRSLGQGIVFFVVALLVFSPWMTRNYWWKNNPIYPLHDNLFNPVNVLQKDSSGKDVIAKKDLGFFGFRSLIYKEKWWEIAIIPVRIFFQGRDGNPKYFDGKLNPFLLLLPLFAFYRVREGPKGVRNEKMIFLAFAALFFGFAFFSNVMRIRYISPIIPPLVILSAFGIRNIVATTQKLRSRMVRHAVSVTVCLVLAFFFLITAFYIVNQFKYVKPFDYLTGKVSRNEYIERFVLEYPALRYINKYLPQDAKILFIFLGKRGYYCDREYVLDRDTLYGFVKMSDSPEVIFERLKTRHITHLLIRYDILDKWKKDIFSDKKATLLDNFMAKYTKMLFYKWGYGVSELVSRPGNIKSLGGENGQTG